MITSNIILVYLLKKTEASHSRSKSEPLRSAVNKIAVARSQSSLSPIIFGSFKNCQVFLCETQSFLSGIFLPRFFVRSVPSRGRTVSVRFYLFFSRFGGGPVVVAGEWLYHGDPQVLAHGVARRHALTTVGCRRNRRYHRRRHRHHHPAPSTWVHQFILPPPPPVRRHSRVPTRRAVA